MEEALLVIDEERRGLLRGERRQTRPFPPLLAQFDPLAHHLGDRQPGADLVEKFGRELHGTPDWPYVWLWQGGARVVPGFSGRARPYRHTSKFATLSALSWMNSRRGSTISPISLTKMSSASSTSRILTCKSVRASRSSVVSQSWSLFISPRPL